MRYLVGDMQGCDQTLGRWQAECGFPLRATTRLPGEPVLHLLAPKVRPPGAAQQLTTAHWGTLRTCQRVVVIG